MSTLKKGIKKIYNFQGMAKFGTQDHQKYNQSANVRADRQSTYLSNLTRLAAPIKPRHRKTVRERQG
jgi:hypothetical protein